MRLSILFILIYKSIFFYPQNEQTMTEFKNLTYKQGLNYIKTHKLEKCKTNLETKEHCYYDGFEKGYLIHFKFINDFTLYPSKKFYEDLMNKEIVFTYPKEDFNNFQERENNCYEKLSYLMKINLTKNDTSSIFKNSIFDRKNLISFYNEDEDFFMDFFCYYQNNVRNELSLKNYEIVFVDEKRYYFFGFNNKDEKYELYDRFYKFFNDPDCDLDSIESLVNVLKWR
jgi:hypothetical protein